MRAEFEMETRRENTNRMLTNGTLQCRRLQTYSISINYQRVAPWVEKNHMRGRRPYNNDSCVLLDNAGKS